MQKCKSNVINVITNLSVELYVCQERVLDQASTEDSSTESWKTSRMSKGTEVEGEKRGTSSKRKNSYDCPTIKPDHQKVAYLSNSVKKHLLIAMTQHVIEMDKIKVHVLAKVTVWPQSLCSQHKGLLIIFSRWHQSKNLPANAGDERDTGWILGSWRSPGGGNGTAHQDSCQENHPEREA